jgi:hypothetical protein
MMMMGLFSSFKAARPIGKGHFPKQTGIDTTLEDTINGGLTDLAMPNVLTNFIRTKGPFGLLEQIQYGIVML